MQDAAITHSNPVCRQANALFAMAIAYSVRTAVAAAELYLMIVKWAMDMHIVTPLMETIKTAASSPPQDYTQKQGWVLIAFQNTLWQLLNAQNLEECVVDTVMRGGDTDTNAAICGALLGAVYGKDAVPTQWLDCLLNCRPDAENPKVRHPRPKCLWPVDALELTENLVRMF